MKVLFLDMDGVVNCKTTRQRHHGLMGIDPRPAPTRRAIRRCAQQSRKHGGRCSLGPQLHDGEKSVADMRSILERGCILALCFFENLVPHTYSPLGQGG
jgi:hypothetical protein